MAKGAVDKSNSEDEVTDLPVGEILRRTRAHYNLTLQEIEHTLRIRAEQLQAIEENDAAALPARVYTLGFVRSYSEHLGLDGAKMVDLYKSQSGEAPVEPKFNYPVLSEETQAPPWWILIVCIIGVGIVMTMWFGEDGESREIVETIPPVPKEMQVAEAPKLEDQPAEVSLDAAEEGAETLAEVEAQAASAAEAIKKGIILNILENSWVEIRDESGKALISQVLKAGDQYLVPDRPDLKISIGNAGGVELEVNGKKLSKLGKRGGVVRNLPLDAEALKKAYPPKG